MKIRIRWTFGYLQQPGRKDDGQAQPPLGRHLQPPDDLLGQDEDGHVGHEVDAGRGQVQPLGVDAVAAAREELVVVVAVRRAREVLRDGGSGVVQAVQDDKGRGAPIEDVARLLARHEDADPLDEEGGFDARDADAVDVGADEDDLPFRGKNFARVAMGDRNYARRKIQLCLLTAHPTGERRSRSRG